jgi:TonB family protein
MSASHITLTAFLRVALLACVSHAAVGVSTHTRGQENKQGRASSAKTLSDDVARGIESYKSGDADAAIKLLRAATKKDKTDADAWYYLGLSYEKQENTKDALKAFEKAISLSLSHVTSHAPAASLDEYNKLNPEGRRVARAQYATYYARAAESVESYIKLRPEAVGTWREQLESLRAYARGLATENDAEAIFLEPDVSQKPVITFRPEPLYTERARQKQTTGYVRLRLVLSADGMVRHILVLKTLPNGLTQQALNVARQITFTPAMKDGRPVSQYVTIDYNFNIY